MYQVHSVAVADGKCSASFSGLAPKPPVASTTAPAVMVSPPTAMPRTRPSSSTTQPVDPLAEGDVDVALAAVAVQHVDDGLAVADGHVHTGDRLVAADDQLVVVLDAEVAEPLHDRARVSGRAALTTAVSMFHRLTCR